MNLKQHIFITEYLRSNDHIMAYKIAYNSTSDFKTIESAANRLLRNPEIAKSISDTQTAIRQQVEEELKAELKRELLTIQKKREILAQIATGEIYAEQNYRGKNCSQCTQFVKPTINQMLKAIDLDNKLAGHYSQKKKQDPTFPVQPIEKQPARTKEVQHIEIEPAPAEGKDFKKVKITTNHNNQREFDMSTQLKNDTNKGNTLIVNNCISSTG